MSLTILSNRYRVLTVLSSGGFGETFLVEDTQMPSNRRCVLKQLKPIHDETPELRQLIQDRFQREAATLETLGEAHDQVPRLHAYFSEAGRFYLVQEWIDGVTITQKVQQEGVQSERTVRAVIARLLDVIAFIHSKGIVHRDIKPDNIILRSCDNSPVLIDFGAVKETMNTVINSQAHSTHSIVVGTPGYMPVEQLSGRPVYSSDIYSLGLTAIYMLTGKTPQEIVSDPAASQFLWREHAPGVSPGFAHCLDTAIHTNTQNRFPTAQKMQSSLNSLLTGAVPTQMSSSSDSSTGHTQRHQAQTILSISSVPHTANTVVVSPASMHNDHSAFVQANREPNSASKSAFIIGGIVGFSILVGSVIVVRSLPESAEPLTASVAPAAPPSTPVPTLPSPTHVPSGPATSSTAESLPIAERAASDVNWKLMGTASSGESVLVNVSSIRPSDDSVAFEYRIGDELVVASANCPRNRWYAEKYGWYSPQSEATQSMLNFVCQ